MTMKSHESDCQLPFTFEDWNKQTPFSTYIKDFNSLRKFLRLIAYGCYYRNIFPNFKITKGNYDKKLKFIRTFCPTANLRIDNHNRNSITHFWGDAYHGADNYLISLFKTKTLKPKWLFFYIIILQIIYASDTPLSTPEIKKKIEDLVNNRILRSWYSGYLQIDTTDDHQFNDCLKLLVKAGYLKSQKRGNINVYTKDNRPHLDLSDLEKQQLDAAIAFYRNISPCSLPGASIQYILRLELQNQKNDNPARLYQFKNNAFIRVIDELWVDILLHAIDNKKFIEVEYRHQKYWSGLPVKIVFHPFYCRQYLLLRTKTGIVWLRIDFIKKIRNAASFSLPDLKPQRESIINLRLHAPTREKETEVLKMISDKQQPGFPSVQVIKDAKGSTHCLLYCKDRLEILPWLRTLPYVEIYEDKKNFLRNRMTNDLKEALTNYGISI